MWIKFSSFTIVQNCWILKVSYWNCKEINVLELSKSEWKHCSHFNIFSSEDRGTKILNYKKIKEKFSTMFLN